MYRLVDELFWNDRKVCPVFEGRIVGSRLGKAEQMSDAVCDEDFPVRTCVEFFLRRKAAVERNGKIFCNARFFCKYYQVNLFLGRSKFKMIYDSGFYGDRSSGSFFAKKQFAPDGASGNIGKVLEICLKLIPTDYHKIKFCGTFKCFHIRARGTSSFRVAQICSRRF